jgi:hypothetical protein
MAKEKELEVRAVAVIPTNTNIVPQNFGDLERFAEKLAKTNMIPTAYKDKPGDCLVAMMMGNELGLPFLQALQGIAVINGKPSIYGDLALALVLSKGLIESWTEYDQNEAGAKGFGFFQVKRKGNSTVREFKFSAEDAKKAGLWGKQGPWTQYPGRMLMFRARGFALRDMFPDALKGLVLVEEAMDYAVEASLAPGVDLVKKAEGAIIPKPNKTEPEPKEAAIVGQAANPDTFYYIQKVTQSSLNKGLYFVQIEGNKYSTTDINLAKAAKGWSDSKTPVVYENDGEILVKLYEHGKVEAAA